MIAWNELTGSIPTEVGLLTELTSLGLCKRLFSVLLLHFEKRRKRLLLHCLTRMLLAKHIRSLLLTCSLLFSLILF